TRERSRIDALLKRVSNHVEWGVRVVLDRAMAAPRGRGPHESAARAASGAAFLARKKAQRDAATRLARQAREIGSEVYDDLAAFARIARRRPAADVATRGGPLLLDAAFLVPKAQAARFTKRVARRTRDLAREGFRVTVSGPWPPYSFVQE
ncbi:MAG TPA: GvpL/GvpF family gas vesicle protein, partial [Vicinamibacterales bacterium]|nr:GvpL/GvpF family gas vesicle protein [Vicinamibacterales bacterium]